MIENRIKKIEQTYKSKNKNKHPVCIDLIGNTYTTKKWTKTREEFEKWQYNGVVIINDVQ